MTGKTHIAIGATVGLMISIGQPIETQFMLILSSVIGSLIPDLDHPKAKLNQKLLIFNNKLYSTLFYLMLAVGLFYLYSITDNFLFRLSGIISAFIGISTHRGFTHSLVGLFLFSWVVKLITTRFNLNSIYIGFVIGYTLHLVADFFTIKGIKLFFPLNVSISSPIILNPNKMYENLVFNFLCIYSMYLLLKII
ncbi:metal-dependent hydrolase [Tissierella sp. Yu-01]|uniref:metal-dependent hydrolase n=1 Tax=Tissierella sp. Yu-01 TaxID=3035694 RepID=UPI00240E2A89|nr:metal-dependent hydrolase [Tissierella sp. Yu-01]WFA10099.1 metal-dependent hydrolase [Tissierella sp. Yu-01]